MSLNTRGLCNLPKLGFLGGAGGKEPACQCRRHETRVQCQGREDPLEEDVATHFSVLAWRIPWMGEPAGLQVTELQRPGHDWRNRAHMDVHPESGWVKIRSQKDFPSGTVSKNPLAMQGTQVQSLVWEVSGGRATTPMSHSYRVCAPEPTSRRCWSPHA